MVQRDFESGEPRHKLLLVVAHSHCMLAVDMLVAGSCYMRVEEVLPVAARSRRMSHKRQQELQRRVLHCRQGERLARRMEEVEQGEMRVNSTFVVDLEVGDRT